MLKDMAYKFAVNEIAPISLECDKEERYTPEIRKKAAEHGLVAAWIPEQQLREGSVGGVPGNVIITEELSRWTWGLASMCCGEFRLRSRLLFRHGRAKAQVFDARLQG